LGVRPDSTSEEIQEAYNELYDKFGPHVNVAGQDPEAMLKAYKDIAEAYEMLMEPNRRKEYDKRSKDSRQSVADLRALWTKHNSGQTGENAKVQALALEAEIEVTLKEAIKGCKKPIRISDPKPCADCSGQKPVNRMQCATCRGLGYFNVERNEEIDLPGGIYDDQEIRLAEKGRYDLRASRNGDLIIKVKLKPHPVLRVLGRDVTLSVPVTIYEALLGAEIEVPCATGRVVMKIQPLTQSGRVYRLKGLGLAGADQLVTIEVVIPQTLTVEEVTAFRKLKDITREPNPRENLFSKS
jgi:DnaJ-class molecular chaperone